ncbi:MAG TPA: cupin domain-containing protein [Dehalococcoidia bacterium]|nr:cupin [Chloroflexota bacterium]HCI85458.1 cupin domain-containing protein [Dehalococcoidia bacterium]|tara:strand:- start:224 stop:586 length:363 start_codon:yes stop_codon:yes gene_type:complete
MLPYQYFYSENDVEKRELLPGVHAQLIWGERIMMGIIDIEPDTEVPEHSHSHEQCGRVLGGAAWFYVGDSEQLLEAGDHYVIPGDVTHRVVATEGGCVALDIWSPIREEYISDDIVFFGK